MRKLLADEGDAIYTLTPSVRRLFGSTGTCLVCDGNIPAFELVMKVRGHNMHLECFKCQECNHR